MKKLFTLLGLIMMMLVVANTSSYGQTYKFILNGANSGDTDYFGWNSSKHNFNNKFTGCTYDGTTFTKGLKMEGETKILFTNTNVANVTIAQSTWSANTIKFDGTELVVADADASITGCRVYTISNVAAGSHEIRRGSGESGLFQVTVEEIASQDEPPIITTQPQDVEYILNTTDYPSVSIVATDDTSNPTTYQWQYSVLGLPFSNVPAAITSGTTNELSGEQTIAYLKQAQIPITAGMEIKVKCVASNTNGSTESNVATLSIKNPYVATPVVSPASGKYGSVIMTATTTTEGATLQYSTNGGLDWLDIPANGQPFTENVTVQVRGICDGYDPSESVEVTYTIVDLDEQVNVTGDATWDWANFGTDKIQLDDTNTEPKKNEKFVLSNVVAYGHCDAIGQSFGNAQQLSVEGEYIVRDGKYFQGQRIYFYTETAGTLSVTYANTGGNPARYINVNGTSYGEGSTSSSMMTTSDIPVEAGEVTIEGRDGESVLKYLRISKIIFTASDGKQASDFHISLNEPSLSVKKTESTDVLYTSSSSGAVSAVSSNDDVAYVTVDQDAKTITITGVKAGTATITVTQEEDDTYKGASQEITVTVYSAYEAQGNNDEFVLTKDNIGGQYGDNPDNDFVTTTTNDWKTGAEYGDYSGDFYNLSKPARSMSFTVHGADNFKLLVQNGTAGRQYTVQINGGDAQTVTHNGTGLEYSPVFEGQYAYDVVITIAGVDGSLYPVAIIFNTADIDPVTLNDYGYATFSSQYDAMIDVDGVTANVFTMGNDADDKGCYPLYVDDYGQIIPAYTGVLLMGEPGTKVKFIYATPDDVTNVPQVNNSLKPTIQPAVTYDGPELVEKPLGTVAVLNGKEFQKYTGEAFLPYRAFFQPVNEATSFKLVFDKKDATAINGVEAEAEAAAPAKVIKNGQLFIGNFNIAGQQVK